MQPGAPEVVPGGFTIAILPDTQFYAQLHQDIFHKQTQWLADNAAKYSMRFVIQVGDVTETSAESEWIVARFALEEARQRLAGPQRVRQAQQESTRLASTKTVNTANHFDFISLSFSVLRHAEQDWRAIRNTSRP